MQFLEYRMYNVNVALTGGTGVSFTDSTLTADSDADFLIKRTSHVATSNLINLKLQDLYTGRFLFKSQEDLRLVSGTALSSITPNGFVPYNWPKPYLIHKLKQFKVSASDFSGSSNTLYLTFHGNAVSEYNKYNGYNPNEKRFTMPFAYESPSMVATASIGARVVGIIQVDEDADFVCTKLCGISTGAGTVSIVTQQDGSPMHWQNIPTHTSNLLGNSQFPNILPSPRFIRKRSTIWIEFANLTASSNTLVLSLQGYKRF